MAYIAPVAFDLESLIEIQRGQVRRRECKPLGKLEKIMFEKSTVSNLIDNPLVGSKNRSASIDWYNTGALVGLSNDRQDILICSPLLHPPRLPAPEFNFKAIYDEQQRIVNPPAPPMLEQRLSNLASGTLRTKSGDAWFVFQPVHQIILILHDRTGWGTIECTADPSGRHTAFLFNPKSQEAHFIYGKKVIDRCHIEQEEPDQLFSSPW